MSASQIRFGAAMADHLRAELLQIGMLAEKVCDLGLNRLGQQGMLADQHQPPYREFAQAVATSKASSLPLSLRSAPGRRSSLSARSRLPSTKRRLVRYTVEPPTATVRAISSSLRPASAASKIWARLSLRAARLPLLNIALSSQRSAWLNSTR